MSVTNQECRVDRGETAFEYIVVAVGQLRCRIAQIRRLTACRSDSADRRGDIDKPGVDYFPIGLFRVIGVEIADHELRLGAAAQCGKNIAGLKRLERRMKRV